MAHLNTINREVKIKEVDLAEVLKRVFNEAEKNTEIIWAHQISYFLTDLNCVWLRRFLAISGFIYGSISFHPAELQEALTKLVRTGFLKIHLFEVKGTEDGLRVGFSRV